MVITDEAFAFGFYSNLGILADDGAVMRVPEGITEASCTNYLIRRKSGGRPDGHFQRRSHGGCPAMDDGESAIRTRSSETWSGTVREWRVAVSKGLVGLSFMK